jgi:hypothetical protein
MYVYVLLSLCLKLTPAARNSSNTDTQATSLKQWVKGEGVERVCSRFTDITCVVSLIFNLVMQVSDFRFILLLLNTFPRYSCLSFSEVKRVKQVRSRLRVEATCRRSRQVHLIAGDEHDLTMILTKITSERRASTTKDSKVRSW